jgi:hypothetical protein
MSRRGCTGPGGREGGGAHARTLAAKFGKARAPQVREDPGEAPPWHSGLLSRPLKVPGMAKAELAGLRLSHLGPPGAQSLTHSAPSSMGPQASHRDVPTPRAPLQDQLPTGPDGAGRAFIEEGDGP